MPRENGPFFWFLSFCTFFDPFLKRGKYTQSENETDLGIMQSKTPASLSGRGGVGEQRNGHALPERGLIGGPSPCV